MNKSHTMNDVYARILYKMQTNKFEEANSKFLDISTAFRENNISQGIPTNLSVKNFENILLPLRSNPHDSVLTDITLKTTVFTESSEDKGEINRNFHTLKRYVSDVVKRSQIWFSSCGQSIPDLGTPCRYEIVEGAKGVGKTHLQNFILARFSKTFDRLGIVWVRINLTREFGDLDKVDLRYWSRCQLAKILLRYYDPTSDFYAGKNAKTAFKWRQHLLKWARADVDLGLDVLVAKVRSVEAVLQNCQRSGLDPDVDPAWMDELIVNEIFRYATSELRLHPVNIIDGMDLLADSKSSKIRYELVKMALDKYLVSSSRDPSYSIIFLRPKSHDDLSKVRTIISGKNSVHNFPVNNRIEACNVNTIFRSRIGYLYRADAKVSLPISDLQEFDNFLKSNSSGFQSKDGRPLSWRSLVSILSDKNARVGMQVFAALGNDFRRRRSAWQGSDGQMKYRFIEQAMVGRFDIPPKPYLYRRGTGRRLERFVDRSGHIYDTMFLPAIFGFPVAEGDSVSQVFGTLGVEKYLCQLRIIQGIRIMTPAAEGVVNLARLIDLLEISFGYDPNESEIICEELVSSEILDVRSESKILDHNSIRYYDARLSPKGERLYCNLMSNISYLALSSVTTSIPDNLFIPTGAFLLEFSSPKSESIEDWIYFRTINGLSMLALLAWANSVQRKRVLAIVDAVSKSLEDKYPEPVWGRLKRCVVGLDDGIFGFIDELERGAISSAIDSVEGYLRPAERSAFYEKLYSAG